VGAYPVAAAGGNSVPRWTGEGAEMTHADASYIPVQPQDAVADLMRKAGAVVLWTAESVNVAGLSPVARCASPAATLGYIGLHGRCLDGSPGWSFAALWLQPTNANAGRVSRR